MGKYQAYEKYNDSGVKWLGAIPEHWEVKRINFLAKRIGDGIHSTPIYVDSSEYYFINGNNLINGNIVITESTKCVSKEEFKKYNLNLDRDTLLLSINGTIGNVAFYQNELVMLGKSAAYIVLKPNIFRNFAYYLFISQNTKNYFFYEVTGTTIFNLSLKSIKNTIFPIPPLDEQEAIARFLDYKTKQIDDLIGKKEALIEKLDEKRTSLISHAVTKGLDPIVPMKDSGIEWLGEVPKHCRRGKLNYFCQIISGGTPDRNNPDFWEGNIPWVKTGEINYQNVYSTEECITKEGLNSSSTTLVKPETVLMAMYGQGNTRGRVAILKIEAAFNQACVAISPLNNLNVYFLYYYLISAYKYIRDTGNESSQMNLSAGIIGKINILVPNLQDQQKVVQYLDKKTNQIDQQKAKIQEAIERLKEYRTSLITNAVTGKIDVRQVPIP